jgi:DNA repair protein RecO
MEYIVHGIILRAQDFKDADRLYSILTLENGLIKASAKSVKKTESKLSGFLLPSNQVVLMLAGGKSGISRIAQVKVEETYSQIVKDHEIFLLFSQSVEVLLSSFKENSAEQDIYRITLLFLNDLNSEDLSIEKKKVLQLSYFSQLLKMLGFQAIKFNIKSKILSNFLELMFKNDYSKNRDLMLKLKVRENDFSVLREWFVDYLQNILERKLNSF